MANDESAAQSLAVVLNDDPEANAPKTGVDTRRRRRSAAQELARRNVSLTLEDQVARLNMSPPVPIDPASVRSPGDPVAFLTVNELRWERPRYLRILTVLLVILISASGIFALGLRALPELVLGIGGIILGIWGCARWSCRRRSPMSP